MAAPTFEAQSSDASGQGDPSSEKTITFATHGPSGIVAGSVCLFVVSVNGGGTTPAFGTVTGWTKLVESLASTGSSRAGICVYYRVMDGTETTVTTSVTPDDGTRGMTAKVVRLAGADTGTPINQSLATAHQAGADLYTVNGVTTTVDDCLVFYCVGSADTAVNTFTTPVALTERWDFGVDPTAANMQVCGTKTQAASGATGAQEFGTSSLPDMVGVAVAVNPVLASLTGNRKMMRGLG